MRHPASHARRPGAVLPMVTVCLVALMAFVCLAIDVGMMAVARTQAQSAADVAAMAGVRTLDGTPGNNKTNAELEAKEAAKANYVLGTQITDGQISVVQSGVYRYKPAASRFEAEFGAGKEPAGNEAWGSIQVVLTTSRSTAFGRIFGISSLNVGARATAVHRPRDISISLDYSRSMRYSSLFNYPNATTTTDVTGAMNADDRYPRFGPWKLYPVATSQATSNPMQYGGTSYVDSAGETRSPNNFTQETNSGPPIVLNFQTTAANNGPNAFVYNGDLTAASFAIGNTPVCTPAPADWSSQYATGYKGDRWPLKRGVLTNDPSVTQYAKNVADVIYSTVPAITNTLADATWQSDGYDMLGLTFTNGSFQGYVMGPAYYGKSFYIWPPDPRWGTSPDPTSINATNPIKDTNGQYIADWRKRFFLYPSNGASNKGAPMDDNSRLWNTTSGSVGVWRDQGIGGTLQYVPNYDAILKWMKSGPQTLPPSLRAGRVLYYSAIPNSIPMNWQTGLISGAATDDERFWKDYIDFVLGAGIHTRKKNLYGANTTNTFASQTFGTPQITVKSALSGTPLPYMNYGDCPVHPRLAMWFGPLTMLGYLAVINDKYIYNWMPGTSAEAQTWQLKAGIRGAIDDIKKNHPNDYASVNFWSNYNGYATPRVPMGRDYTKMRNCLYYPFSLLDSMGTLASEKRPYKSESPTNASPSGLDPFNFEADIPNGEGATNPSMGLMVSYNQFNWTGTYTGRKGATKIVILETDGAANYVPGGSFVAISGGGGAYEWTGVSSASVAPNPYNGHPNAMNPALTVAWLICQDAAGTKAWPTLPAYTSGTGLATAGAPTKWSGLTRNGPGYSTPRNPARIHTLAFGELFEDTTASPLKTRALEFLRNVQIIGGTLPSGATSIESYKIITGTSTQRVNKIKQALEIIMQGGVQVALIE